ncbi:MAG: response regulator [Oscillochloris sp.]|nr:response regulator [Oscillochloris sp.]
MKTILVVDDNFDNRNIIAQMLQISGYRVVCATDGFHAIDMAISETPDLIMMDMAMPKLDGWSATVQLKAHPELAHVPVIAVTGHVTHDEIARAISAGCEDYLPKPIDYETMIFKVRTHLTSRICE